MRGPTGGRRPPAPIGWGSLTVRTSFWRSLSRDGPGGAGSDPLLRSTPRGGPRAAPAPREGTSLLDAFHRARLVVAAVGLGRQPPDETRTPSIGSTRALQPERARPRLLFTRVASPRTLSLAASLSLPRQRQTGRLELSRAPASRPAVAGTEDRAHHGKDASHRLLQPTSITSTLRITRFPVALRPAIRLAASHGPGADSAWA